MRLNSCITNSSGCFGETVRGVCAAKARRKRKSAPCPPSSPPRSIAETHLIDKRSEINRPLLRIIKLVHRRPY